MVIDNIDKSETNAVVIIVIPFFIIGVLFFVVPPAFFDTNSEILAKIQGIGGAALFTQLIVAMGQLQKFFIVGIRKITKEESHIKKYFYYILGFVVTLLILVLIWAFYKLADISGWIKGKEVWLFIGFLIDILFNLLIYLKLKKQKN